MSQPMLHWLLVGLAAIFGLTAIAASRVVRSNGNIVLQATIVCGLLLAAAIWLW